MKKTFKSLILLKPELSKGQFIFFASAIRAISEGVILGASAAFFLPETLQLREPISIDRYVAILLSGLLLLSIGAIFEKRGER